MMTKLTLLAPCLLSLLRYLIHHLMHLPHIAQRERAIDHLRPGGQRWQ